MPHRISRTVACLALLFAGTANVKASDAPPPYNVDRYLERTNLGAVSRSPDGKRVAYEHLRPYAEATYPEQVDTPFMANRLRSRLFVGCALPDLRCSLAPVEVSVPGAASTWAGAWAPDSSAVLVYSFDAKTWGVHVGVWDVARRTYRRLPGTVDFTPAGAAIAADWIGPTAVAYAALDDEGLPREFRNSELASKPWIINDSTGEELQGESLGTTLRIYRLDSGLQTSIAAHDIERVVAGPDGRHIAILYYGTVAPPNPNRLETGSSQSSYQLARRVMLAVYDQHTDRIAATSAPDSDVFPASLAWEPRGNALAYIGKERAGTWEENAGVWTLGVDGRGARLATQSLELYSWYSPGAELELAAGTARARLGWHAGKVLAQATLKNAKSTGARSNAFEAFWLLGEHEPPQAIEALLSTPAQQVCTHGENLLIVRGGRAHLRRPDGSLSLVPLTSGISVSAILSSFTTHSAGYPLSCAEGADGAVLAAVTLRGESKVGTLSVSNGAFWSLDEQSRNKSFAVLNQLAVLDLERTAGYSQLTSRSADDRRVLVTAGLGQVALGEVVSVPFETRSRLAGQRHQAWLVLPPEYRPGQRLPLVALVYSGTVLSPSAPTAWVAGVDSHLYWNAHLFASEGYAVLVPSLPLGTNLEVDIGALLEEAATEAIDRVVELGYADASRIALVGHSGGGYTSLLLASRMENVRAVISHAGVPDLIDFYSSFGSLASRESSYGHTTRVWWAWAERGTGRMGSSPWDDPQSYIDRSPVFQVKNIGAPVLLISGIQDSGMQRDFTMFNALYRLNKPARMLRFRRGGHFMIHPEDIEEVFRQSFAWLGRFLKDTPGTR